MTISNMSVEEVVVFEVYDKDGNLKDKHEQHNLIPTAGLAWVAKLIGDASPPAAISHMGVGTGTTAASAADVALQTPLGARVAVTRTYESTPAHRAKFIGEFTGIEGAVTEEGLFNALTGGTMVARSVSAAMNLTASDTLRITHYITPSAS